MNLKFIYYVISFSVALLSTSCRTCYVKNKKFNTFFENQKFIEADNLLKKDKKSPKSKSKLLYYLNRGIIKHLLKEYSESNNFFEIAYTMSQDYSSNLVTDSFYYFLNPNYIQYSGEINEILLIHYYKALNFAMLNDFDSALVECRRLNIQLNMLCDKYSSKKNIYRYSAFCHLFMGIIYQSNRDYNNAFIAYRNAISIYEKDYTTLFGIGVPDQLKFDIIYAADMAGFHQEADYYRNKFKIKTSYNDSKNQADFICFWHNGLGPVKNEEEIDFCIIKGAGGVINFSNKDYNLFFSFPLLNLNVNEEDLLSLNLLRIVYPTYVERNLKYNFAHLIYKKNFYVFEKIEDINAVAIQILKDRRSSELGKTLLKIAVKKVLVELSRKKNQLLGTAFDIFSFITERADTRNWQTIPHSIYYKRIHLPSGKNKITFTAQNNKASIVKTYDIDINIVEGNTYLHIINTY